MNNILKVKNYTIKYDNQVILKNLDFNIKKNKITAIIGPSGCGKSSLLLGLNGLIFEKNGGEVDGKLIIDKNELNYNSLRDDYRNLGYLRKEIGIVFQKPVPFPLSIKKNMEFALKYNGIKKRERNSLIIDCLKEVNLYEEIKNDLNKSALKLSGGQQQRLCIARALTTKPKVLLLDEPCSSLDVMNINKIETMLEKIKKNHSIILVTHNISQAKRIADEVIFMLNGEIINRGTKDYIFNQTNCKKTYQYISGKFG